MMMTINEAYNKGLDVAETEVLDKLSKALRGEDTEPFVNPKMEEFRKSLFPVPCEQESKDVDPPLKMEDLIHISGIKDILLGKKYPYMYRICSDEGLVVTALTNLMDFIYTKASKGNNGSKNYVQMVETLKKDLTFENKPLELI